MLLSRKIRCQKAAKERLAKHGPPVPKGKPRGGAAAKVRAKIRATAQEVMDEMGFDPIKQMVMWAEGDVVGLGLMTKEQLDEPARRLKRANHWYDEPSGLEKSYALISTDMRSSMAKELAKYGYSKKPQSVEVSGNAGAAAGVVFYLPQNGRDELTPKGSN